jgi:hypothetical protein
MPLFYVLLINPKGYNFGICSGIVKKSQFFVSCPEYFISV